MENNGSKVECPGRNKTQMVRQVNRMSENWIARMIIDWKTEGGRRKTPCQMEGARQSVGKNG